MLDSFNHFHIWQKSPVKHERDIQQLNSVLTIVKNRNKNGAEEIALVPPTPEPHLIHDPSHLHSDNKDISSEWRHNGCDGVSNHQPHHCLLNRLFRRRSKKTSKLRVTGLCAGNSPVTGEFPAPMASNADDVIIINRFTWKQIPKS